jgi:transglutaminase-like putative cysteine protease
VGADDPQHWLGPSALIDLEDPKLRLRVRALTQLCKNDREKALAIYSFVKLLPLSRRVKLRPLSAREVFDAGRGDASDKATLLVAMLRLAQVHSRLRFV